ncbi:uncharacterized protein [Nicotiana tomentosiformis]|uniref:uncharacterized protein n=1 Tax=Nicotiana tomentosiformis TaxID=4098 RepID=UPI00388C3C68
MVRAASSEEEQLRLERYKKYHPLTFNGLATDDAQGFLEECHRILRTIGIVEMSGVDFVTFQLRGVTYQWRAYELGSPSKSSLLTWVQFSKMFLREFLPSPFEMHGAWSLSSYARGTMSVSEYAVRFSDLARHAPTLVATLRDSSMIFGSAWLAS